MWLKDVCQITQTDTQAVGRGDAIPTKASPAHAPQLAIDPDCFLEGNQLFEKQGE